MVLWRSLDSEIEVVTWQIVFDDYTQLRQGVMVMRQWFHSHTAYEARQAVGDSLSWDGPTGAARLISNDGAVWLVAATDATTADELVQGILRLGWTNYWKPER